MLTEKQNSLEILRFGTPERITGGLSPARSIGYFGVNHESHDGGGHHLPVGSAWTDIWGTRWHREHDGVMGFPRGYPLADLPASLKGYRWPDPDDARLCRQIYTGAEGVDRETVFLCGSHRDTLWEKAYMLCGMEGMMCAFHSEPTAAREVLHRIMDFQLSMARHYLAVGVDAVNLGDDLGTQRGLLLSPEIVETFLLPEYRRLFDLYQQHRVIIQFHSCGQITPLLETFIALGVDCLNPVQASANDLAEVRRITQGRMALQGGVSSAVIVEGPVERIRAEVRRCLWLLGRDGGYFCAPDQGMPWPEAHIAAFWEAVEEFGRYPLQEPLGIVCQARSRAECPRDVQSVP
jgi:uroporphyrinogen decarboxylase